MKEGIYEQVINDDIQAQLEKIDKDNFNKDKEEKNKWLSKLERKIRICLQKNFFLNLWSCQQAFKCLKINIMRIKYNMKEEKIMKNNKNKIF